MFDFTHHLNHYIRIIAFDIKWWLALGTYGVGDYWRVDDFDVFCVVISAGVVSDIYKEEITKEIEVQIVTRFYFQSGKAKQKLNGDSEVQEAIALLNDKERYNELLGK